MNAEPVKRDAKGDVIFPEIPTSFWDDRNAERWTYVFEFKFDGFFFPCDHSKHEYEGKRTDLPKFDLAEHRIFNSPELPVSDEWIRYRNTYDYYYKKFFAPVLSRTIGGSDGREKIDLFKLILPQNLLSEILQFIDKSGLKKHEDFILFLVAKIESIYIHDIEFYDNLEEQRNMKKFPGEVDNLVRALKLTETDYSTNIPKPELEQIAFYFTGEKPIKITNRMLTSSITKATIDHYSDGKRKDWKKQLKAFPDVFTDNEKPNEFRHRICKALHNFFKAVNAFEFNGSKTTDSEVYAIARILDFANVKFRDKKHNEFDIEIDQYDIIKNVRNAITRKELVYPQTHFGPKEINIDFQKLLKYFEKDFIASGDELIFSEQDLRVVATITDRFNINPVFPEMLHLFNCLKQWLFKIGHQFECCINEEIKQNTDYSSWDTLLQTIQNNEKINHVELKLNDGSKTISFSEALSTEIFAKALTEYYQKHPFEFEVDFYESEVKVNPLNGGFRLITSGKLHQPTNRFFPKFCKKCYEFLLNECPPGDKDLQPSDRYFGAIAQMLLESYSFKHQMWEEEFITEQVKHWYNL